MPEGITNPKAIAEEGERIYLESYKAEYEKKYAGKFVAIDINTKEAFLDDYAEGALEKAKAKSPHGLFHLIRVGSPGAFRVSYSSDANLDWIFQ
ncbi:MAG: hypothetical protein HY656_03865 [Acidobacteria bacterium]|nr:hypothetical protein [Acidobacteriota bacterium]